jgi:predicted DNA-binding helix-hairpin-helix protein
MNMKRVYYSSYMHINDDSKLPVPKNSPLLREHRLYQADWLLRFYKFGADELLDEEHPNLDENFDPKAAWALRHLEYFPVEVNNAEYEVLLRVPGVGVRSAQRIVRARRARALEIHELKKIGVVMKRAKYFVTAKGKRAEDFYFNERIIRGRLLEAPKKAEQLALFAPHVLAAATQDDVMKSLTGEL